MGEEDACVRVARMECAETSTPQRVGVRQIEAMGVDEKSGKVKRNGTESVKASNALDVYSAFAKKPLTYRGCCMLGSGCCL
jgi:hypothetical protein